ncbi:helix-turn-helix domain-containing protein [Streptomyces sp. SID8364]|nr:helix-turn-helix domain-containing protein [Streptomyces sp. SID8364]
MAFTAVERPDQGEKAHGWASAGLRDQVIRYRGYRMAGARPARTTLPAGSVTLLLGWGTPLHMRHGPNNDEPPGQWPSLIAGLQTTPVLAGYPGPGHAIEVDFTPLGAYRCLGIPLHHLAETRVHPDHVMGTGWTERTTARLSAAQNWSERWAIVDSILINRCIEHPPPSPLMVEAWNLLRARDGSMPVSELVTATGRGRRRIQALFREHIGVPPQTLSRIFRFQHALAVPATEYRSMAELATMTGYYDQAHMNRDFRSLSGYTPGQLFNFTVQAAARNNSDNDKYMRDFFAH